MKFKSKNGKEAKILLTPGIYYYLCTPHKGMGMIGLVVVGNDMSNIDEVKKAKAYGKVKKLKKLLANFGVGVVLTLKFVKASRIVLCQELPLQKN